MQSIAKENLSEIKANICSYFIDKSESECYNKVPSSTLGGALYDLLQQVIRTQILFSIGKDQYGGLPFSTAQTLPVSPFNKQEVMNRQEKQRKLNELLKFLAATPNSD